MANNPITYDCRVDLKNLFSALSECRRAALRELPLDFFVDFFQRIVTELKTSNDYRGLCYQAFLECWTDRSSKPTYRGIWRDATIEIFEQELERRNISNSYRISEVYGEYLLDNYYVLVMSNNIGQKFQSLK